MLREVKSRQLKNRLYAFQTVSTSTPSIVASVGKGNLSSVTRSGGLTQSLNLLYPARQLLCWIGSQANTNGGFVTESGSTVSNVVEAKARNNAGSVQDGTTNYLVCGPDSATIDSLPGSNVLTGLDRQRIIWGKVTGSSGAVTIGKTDFSVTRASAGVYTVVYKKAFGRAALAFATPIGALFMGVKVSNQTASGCTITFAETTPTATDSDFYVLAVGIDSIEETSRGRYPLLNSQRKPRIECVRFTTSGGTPTIVVGTKTAAITDNGTGDFSLTLTNPFKREFASFATGTTAGATALQSVLATANTSSVSQIQTYSAANALTDPSGSAAVSVIFIGSDDATEF